MLRAPLPDDAWVVRGGSITAEKLRSSCASHEGVYGFSVQAEAGRSILELCRAGQIPHGKIGVTTVRQVRELGYNVARTTGKGDHATVVVPKHWSEADARRLAERFESHPNPAREQ